jgi:hypothetical protein
MLKKKHLLVVILARMFHSQIITKAKPFKTPMRMKPILTAGLMTGAFAIASCTPTQQNYQVTPSYETAYGYDTNNHQRKATQTVPPPSPPSPPLPPVQSANGKYPTAHRTEQSDVVISPYKPYNKVRVRGFKPGELAQDPQTGEIFVVPN